MPDPFEVSESDALRDEAAIDSAALDQRLTQASDVPTDAAPPPAAPQPTEAGMLPESPQPEDPLLQQTAYTERGTANKIETGVEKPEVIDFDRNALRREGPPPGWSPGGERGG